MADFRYVIVGGGMTADAAVRGIRMTDSTGTIAVISEEAHPPYNRPPLSKALWKGEPVSGIWRGTPGENLEMILSRKVVRIDAEEKRVFDGAGDSYAFGKLLLATGGRPRRLAGDTGGAIYFRTLDDYTNLRELSGKGGSFAVIGGGFIGSEIAAALALNGKSVTMLFPGTTVGGGAFPPALGNFLNGYYREKGVALLAGESVSGIERRGGRFIVHTGGRKLPEFDGVVAGIGIEPNTELASGAGLTVENGIRVDRFLRTSQADIYAAGDVANFPWPAGGGGRRVEHEDNALAMGTAAGRNMAGESVSYDHVPFFYSDLFDIGYEAVGELDARLDVIPVWKEEFREGVVYYLDAGRIRGVLLWNTWGKVDAARALLKENVPRRREELPGLIGS